MPMIKCTCLECGKEFELERYRIKHGGGKYCSRQCSCRVTGRKPTKAWNKGKTKDNNKKLQEIGNKISQHKLNYYKNNEIWNKGLTKETDERVAAYVEKQTEIRNTEGPAKEAWREAMSKGQVKAHAEGKYPRTFTKLEQKTWDYLESIGLTVKKYKDKSADDEDEIWYHSFPVGKFVADFGCPSKRAVIECNGCYVHRHNPDQCQHRTLKYGHNGWCEDNIKKDRRKISYYKRYDWKWAIVWECEAEQGDFHRIKEYLC